MNQIWKHVESNIVLQACEAHIGGFWGIQPATWNFNSKPCTICNQETRTWGQLIGVPVRFKWAFYRFYPNGIPSSLRFMSVPYPVCSNCAIECCKQIDAHQDEVFKELIGYLPVTDVRNLVLDYIYCAILKCPFCIVV